MKKFALSALSGFFLLFLALTVLIAIGSGDTLSCDTPTVEPSTHSSVSYFRPLAQIVEESGAAANVDPSGAEADPSWPLIPYDVNTAWPVISAEEVDAMSTEDQEPLYAVMWDGEKETRTLIRPAGAQTCSDDTPLEDPPYYPDEQTSEVELSTHEDDSNAPIQITSPTTFPYSSVVIVSADFSDGITVQGTGVMIGQSEVLTAGHIIYREDHGGWAKSYSVTTTRTNKPIYVTNRAVASTKWLNYGDDKYEYDYGLVLLNDKPDIGYWGFRAETTATLLNSTFLTYGFPGNKPAGTLWRTGGYVESVSQLRFAFRGEPSAGFSGGPVIKNYDPDYIVGIFSGSATSSDGEQCGMAVRVTNDVVNFIREYKTY